MITVILTKQHQNDIASNIKLAASNDNDDYDTNWVRLLNPKKQKKTVPPFTTLPMNFFPPAICRNPELGLPSGLLDIRVG